MNLKKMLLLNSFLLATVALFPQTGDWYNLDFSTDSIAGISANKIYTIVDKDKIQRVIVAVIDDGVDIKHPDLEGRIWINEKEIAGNGIDDDGNGYIDDLNGWNFLGNPNGENIKHETLEITRLYRQFKDRFENVDPENVPKSDKKDYAKYLEYKTEYDERVAPLEEQFAEFAQLTAMYNGAYAYMQERTGHEELNLEDLTEFTPADDDEQQVVNFLLLAERENLTEYLEEGSTYFERSLKYNYNLEFNPRDIVNVKEAMEANTGYGNNMVWAENPDHGTHVSGIIAAVRGNNLGVDGVASNAVIMPIRAVPGGDERDEDVALAIRYAVDNGAKVVNMSFGKAYSPHKELVFDAIRYAESKDVLLIHAAGNDATNNDKVPNFPDGTLGKKKTASNVITVGASGPQADSTLLAGFSNFGKKKVDVLAPGVEIESLVPEGGTKANSGTSMAAPVVSGLAALIRGLYPELSASEVKDIILKSASSYGDVLVNSMDEPTPLKKIVRNPAVVSAEKAVILAGEKTM